MEEMKRNIQCPTCGTMFMAGRISQKYCSAACRRYAHRHGMNDHKEPAPGEKSLRTFRCMRCGVRVKVTSRYDKRKKFCSAHCERLYWKHSPKNSVSLTVRRTFVCRNCSTVVKVSESGDKRSVFCSADCRKQWFSEHRPEKKKDHTVS